MAETWKEARFMADTRRERPGQREAWIMADDRREAWSERGLVHG